MIKAHSCKEICQKGIASEDKNARYCCQYVPIQGTMAADYVAIRDLATG